MDLPNSLLIHLNKVGYNSDLSLSDLQQAAQGVARPILQFLMHVVYDSKNATRLRSNLEIFTKKEKKEQEKRPQWEREKRLEKIAAENLQKIEKLKEAVRVKKAEKMILACHKRKLDEITHKMEDFKDQVKIVNARSQVIDSENLVKISENLSYISNSNGSLDLNNQTIDSISSSFCTNLKAVNVFPPLLETLTSLKQESIEKIKTFSPEEEFSYLGLSLQKENGVFRVQEVNNDTLIDRLAKEVTSKQETIWQEFEKTESILEEAERLKHKLQNLVSKQVFLTPKAQKFHLLSLNLAGKKVELESLKNILQDFEFKLQEKQNHDKICRTHSEKIGNTELLAALTSETYSKNSSIRREILKKKLQIEEFINKHLQDLKSSIPDKLNSLHRPFHRELRSFNQISHFLLPYNSPNPRDSKSEEPFKNLFNQLKLSKKLFSLCQITKIEKYSSSEFILKKLESTVRNSQKFEEIVEVHNSEITINTKGKPISQSLKDLKEDQEKASKAVSDLDETLDIWLNQPAQHLIPWKKDHHGLSITESLELWKSSILET